MSKQLKLIHKQLQKDPDYYGDDTLSYSATRFNFSFYNEDKSKSIVGFFEIENDGIKSTITHTNYSPDYVRKKIKKDAQTSESASISTSVLTRSGSFITTYKYLSQLDKNDIGKPFKLKSSDRYITMDTGIPDCSGDTLNADYQAVFYGKVKLKKCGWACYFKLN